MFWVFIWRRVYNVAVTEWKNIYALLTLKTINISECFFLAYKKCIVTIIGIILLLSNI